MHSVKNYVENLMASTKNASGTIIWDYQASGYNMNIQKSIVAVYISLKIGNWNFKMTFV